MFVALVVLALLPSQGFEGYYRFPALHQDTVVFTAEGDLWRVPIAGGLATRLTTHLDEETRAVISPDGAWIAFSGRRSGANEVYVMPSSGGLPKRLTFDGRRSQPQGWTSDGKVIFRTPNYATLPGYQLATVDPASGDIAVIPLAQAENGVYADNGDLYFVRLPRQGSATKRYKGGIIQQIWRFKNGAKEAENLTGDFDGTSKDPMLWNKRLYFLSDRDGIMNLYSANLDGKDIQKLTTHPAFDAKDASLSQGRIAYQHGADLRLYDIAAGTDRKIDITLATDLDQVRERWMTDAEKNINAAYLSPDGKTVAVTIRGRIFTVPAKQGRIVQVTRHQDVRWRDARWTPDGKGLYALSDKSGEMEVWRLDPRGIEEPKQLTKRGPGFRDEVIMSPDGRYLVISEFKDSQMWLVDTQDMSQKLISEAPLYNASNPSFSPDGKWVVFGEPAANSFETIRLYNVETGALTTVTSDRFNDGAAAWGPDGKWMAMVSERNLTSRSGSPWGAYAPQPLLDRRDKMFLVSLQKGTRSPFAPWDELVDADKPEPVDPIPSVKKGKKKNKKDKQEETKAETPKFPAMDLEGMGTRLHEVPIGAGNYWSLTLTKKHLYYMSRQNGSALYALPLKSDNPKPVKIVDQVGSYDYAAESGKILVYRNNKLHVFDANGKAPNVKKSQVELNGLAYALNPQKEWSQMFEDSWRLMRDYFYDKGMHGVDWEEVAERHRPLLSRITDREELTDLLESVHGELSALHVSVYSGEVRETNDKDEPAFLGAVMTRDAPANGYRLTKIYSGDPDVPSEHSPLAKPGVDLEEGDIITHINGVPTLDVDHPNMLLRNTVGKQVLLHITQKDGAERQVIVNPISGRTFGSLRYSVWEYERRMRVEDQGEGDIGYLHLRAMGRGNYDEFARHYFPVANRKGLIVDVRHNRGGNIDAWILNMLSRKTWMWWQARQGLPFNNMHFAFNGHMVVLINEYTASDGEAFAEGFRRLGLGQVIGRRTWGGEIWLSGGNRLVDGGAASAPEFGVFKGDEWLIEGIGVIPDIEVDNLPHATFNGKDAQLEAAVKHLQKLIAEQPVEMPTAPPYPDKSHKPD